MALRKQRGPFSLQSTSRTRERGSYMMKKLLTILTPLALIFAFANPVHATCDRDRLKVVRSEGPYIIGGVPGYYFYDLAPPTVLPIFYYRFQTTDPDMIDHLNSAWVGRFTVRVIGNAASCGTTGTIRGGGTITFIYRDSFF
jgi:hypothetical protein